jgi:hypothetical protein
MNRLTLSRILKLAGAAIIGLSLGGLCRVSFGVVTWFPLNGNAVGTSHTDTSNTGGFSSWQNGATNNGLAAMLLDVRAGYDYDKLRVVVFGTAGDWKMYWWTKANYLAGNAGTLFELPNTTFGSVYGNAGPAGSNADTYLLEFNISAWKPPTGEVIVAFQSSSTNSVKVTGSNRAVFPVSYWSNQTTARGLLGGTGHIGWGMTITADVMGDYNQDGTVNNADYTVWQDQLGDQNSYDNWYMNYGNTID